MAKNVEAIDIPMNPIYTNKSATGFKYPYYDYYCPNCMALAAYDAVGKRRMSRSENVRTRCNKCGQLIEWTKGVTI